MRQGQQNRRGRGRNNNRKGQNPLSRSFESNGPDVKIRGTPAHIAEKYLSLARDAQSSGDPVLAENYLQHAEHYSRIIMAYREQLQQPGDMANGHGQRVGEGGDEMRDEDGEDGMDDAFQPQPQPQMQPQRQHTPYEGNRHDRPFRRDQGRFRDRDRFNDRDRGDRDRGDRDRHQGAPQAPAERQEAGGEPRPQAAERHEGAGNEQQRRRERFPQQQHEQPEFLRRSVRRTRSEGDEAAAPPAKDEPSRD